MAENSNEAQKSKEERTYTYSDMKKMFNDARNWGETYYTWFKPTEEDHNNKFDEIMDSI